VNHRLLIAAQHPNGRHCSRQQACLATQAPVMWGCRTMADAGEQGGGHSPVTPFLRQNRESYPDWGFRWSYKLSEGEPNGRRRVFRIEKGPSCRINRKVLLTGRRSSALRHYCASSVRERCELRLSTERNGGRFDDGSSDQLPEMQKLHGRGFYSRWNRRLSSHNRRMVWRAAQTQLLDWRENSRERPSPRANLSLHWLWIPGVLRLISQFPETPSTERSIHRWDNYLRGAGLTVWRKSIRCW